MSVHLFNFCVYHNYLDQLEASGKTLPEPVWDLMGLNTLSSTGLNWLL